jgi:hypothetical protein
MEHLAPYLRMLDANADGADWREVSRIVLHIDAEREPDRARRANDSQLVDDEGRIQAVGSAGLVGRRL